MLVRMWCKGTFLPSLLVGVQTFTSITEINMGIIYLNSCYTAFEHIPKGCSITPQRHSLSYAHCSFMQNGNQHRCPSIEKRIKKMCYVSTMEYYLPVRKLYHGISGKWMQLEKIILSKVSLTQKDKYGMYSLICRYSLLNKSQ